MLEMETSRLGSKAKQFIPIGTLCSEITYDAGNLIIGKATVLITAIIAFISLLISVFGSIELQNIFIINGCVWLFICVVGVLAPGKDDIVIKAGRTTIRFYRDLPNEETVLEFANVLINLANKKRIEMLTDFKLDEQVFIENLKRLRDTKRIDETEFMNLKENYDLQKNSQD